jgi:hypothetical protein
MPRIHPEIGTFPLHFHDGKENNITSSQLNINFKFAFKEVLGFIKTKLKEF